MVRIWFAHPGKDSYSSTCCCDELKSSKQKHAVVAQLVEHHLAKVDVASSSLVNRSTEAPRFASGLFRCLQNLPSPGVLGFGGADAGWGSCDLLEVAAWVGWLSACLVAWLCDYLSAWLSGCRDAVREEKIFKKFGYKACRGRVKLLSEPPSKLL